VPIPTAPLPIDPSGAYEGVPVLAELGSRLGHAGGINAPKVAGRLEGRGLLGSLLVPTADSV
jgi:hypothetical protein